MRPASLLLLLLLSLEILAAGRELAPRPLQPVSNTAIALRSAAAGGRFFTIWTLWSFETSNTAVMGTLHDASGRRISPRAFPVLDEPGAFTFSLVGTGDSFALFWSNGASEHFLSDIDLEGRITRTTRRRASRP